MKTNSIADDTLNTGVVLLCFYSDSCAVCQPFKNKLQHLLAQYPAVRAVFKAIDAHQKFASQRHVFTVPLAILYVNGRDVKRFGSAADFAEIEALIARNLQMIE